MAFQKIFYFKWFFKLENDLLKKITFIIGLRKKRQFPFLSLCEIPLLNKTH